MNEKICKSCGQVIRGRARKPRGICQCCGRSVALVGIKAERGTGDEWLTGPLDLSNAKIGEHRVSGKLCEGYNKPPKT